MASFSLVESDAVAFLNSLPPDSVQACVTDIAYESLERHRAVGTTTRLSHSKSSSNDWFDTFPNSRLPELFAGLYRTLQPRSYALMFCDDPTNEVMRPAARDAGFWVWGSWVWVKTAKNQPAGRDENSEEGPLLRTGMGYHGLKCTELILVLEKRTKKQVPHAEWDVRVNPKGEGKQLNDKVPEVFFCPRSDGKYPTEKPLALLKSLVSLVASPGNLVVDPFFGSASGGHAALEHDCDFLGSDISEKALLDGRARLLSAGGVEL